MLWEIGALRVTFSEIGSIGGLGGSGQRENDFNFPMGNPGA